MKRREAELPPSGEWTSEIEKFRKTNNIYWLDGVVSFTDCAAMRIAFSSSVYRGVLSFLEWVYS